MEKERDRVRESEARVREQREKKETRGRGKGEDPLRDSPIDKSDVGKDMSPDGSRRRDLEAIKVARKERGVGQRDRSERKGRSREKYDEKMSAMKKDMADLKNRVNKLEKTVQKQAEKLKGQDRSRNEKTQERGKENERGRDRQRQMDRGRDR